MRQVIIYPDVEDGGWISEVPSLPGCISQGQTRVEALANIRDTIDEWVAGAREVGTSIPAENFDVQECVIEAAGSS